MSDTTKAEAAIFEAAMAVPNAEQRKALLDAACHANPELRERIEGLLAANEEADDFMQQPAVELTDETIDTLPTEKPGTIIGRYKLLEQIGEGGFGTVYMADQLRPIKRRVALKIIKLGMDSKQVVARFEAERQALALMDHPNIAKILDAGTTDTGRPYFVMELVRGIPVTEYCDDRNLTTEERLKLFGQICAAVQHAHQKGIIHRDIKPSNILVSTNGDSAVPKVIDFGIAKATQGRLTDKTLFTQFRQFIGTPAYMSPEQAQMSAVDVDTRSDIYSLGVLLYELLTGQTPLDSHSLVNAGYEEICRRIREEEPAIPSRRLSSLQDEELSTAAKSRKIEASSFPGLLRGDLDWITMKAVEKDRARRYETADALAKDVEHFLQGEPVNAAPPSAGYLLKKFVGRNYRWLATASMFAAVLLVATIVSSWFAISKTHLSAQLEHQIVAKDEAYEKVFAAERKARDAQATAELNEKRVKRNLYATEMLAAQREFNDLNTPGVTSLLEKYVAAGGNDYRGFEWRWLWNHCNQELFTLEGHSDTLRSIRFSPDGKWLATGSTDGTARLWDLEKRTEVWQFKGGTHCNNVDFSTDGKTLITKYWMPSNPDNLPSGMVWDLSEPGVPKNPQPVSVSMRFGPDGRLWNGGAEVSISGEQLRNLGTTSNTGQDFSRDGRTVAWLDWEGNGYLLDAETEELTSLPLHKGYTDVPVKGMAISPLDDDIIATGSLTFGVAIWNRKGEMVQVIPGSQGKPISMIDFSKDGDLLAVRYYRGAIRIYETTEWQEVISLRTSAGNSLAFSPVDNHLLIGGGEDGSLRAWRVDPQRPLDTKFNHPNEVVTLTFSPDGRMLAVGMKGGGVRFWDVRSREELFTRPQQTEVFSTLGFGNTYINDFVVFSPDNRFVAMIGPKNEISVWDIERKLRVAEHSLSDEGKSIRYACLSFSRDGRKLYAAVSGANEDRFDAYAWDGHTARLTLSTSNPTERMYALSVSANDGFLAGAGLNKQLQVFDFSKSELLRSPLNHKQGYGQLEVAFSPLGTLLAACGESVQIVDVAKNAVVGHLNNKTPGILHATWAPDNSRIAVSDYRAVTTLWDVDAQQVIATYRGRTCAFSPDGTILAVGSADEFTSTEEKTREVTLLRALPLEEIDRRMVISATAKPK